LSQRCHSVWYRKIRQEPPVAVKQPRFPAGADRLPFLQKRPERRDARSRPDHDDRRAGIRGQLEIGIVVHIHRHRVARLHPFGEPGGADAVPVATVGVVPHHPDGQVRLVRERLQTAGDGIFAGRDFAQKRHQLPHGHAFQPVVTDQIEQVPSLQVFPQLPLFSGLKQSAHAAGIEGFRHFFQQRSGEHGDFKMFQKGFPERHFVCSVHRHRFFRLPARFPDELVHEFRAVSRE